MSSGVALKDNLRIVLHQIQGMDNLGAVARLMANFGLGDLWLSAPVTTAFADAERMAVKAGHLLQQMKVVGSLPEALGDVVYAIGSTSREDVEGRAALTPEEAIARLSQASRRGRVALVLGGERRGLSDGELAACQDLLVIPTSDLQPSMNLAQAAAVLLYLASRHERAEPEPPPEAPAATLRVMQVLDDKMRQTLLSAGFLNPQQAELILRELQRSLSRAQLTQREAELWTAAFKQLARMTGAPEAGSS